MDDKRKDARKLHHVGGLVLGLLGFRLFYLTIVPFDLVHDEAYYWDWSRRLDWCYFSKPPGIAWLIALVTRLTANTEFYVRLPAAILSTLSVLFAYLLGNRMFGHRAGILAAALTSLTPGNVASGVMMTIDAPFLCCWAMSLYFFWRMLEHDSNRICWGLLTAASVGMGLLFKQTMVAFPVLAISFVVCSSADRSELRKASFWAVGVLALAFLIPVVIWNSQNDWITFAHTQNHFQAERVSTIKKLARGGEFILSQMGLISPSTYLVLTMAMFGAARGWPSLGRREKYLVSFCILPVVLITALSFRQRVEANWPAPFYASGILLMSAALTRDISLPLPQWALRSSLQVGAVAVVLTYLSPFAISAAGLKGSSVDVAVRMWGWEELGARIGERMLSQRTVEKSVVVVNADRGLAAELAFYLPGQPRVVIWNEHGKIASQYDIWGIPDLTQKNVFLVSRGDLPQSLLKTFAFTAELEPIEVGIGNGRSLSVSVGCAQHAAAEVNAVAIENSTPRMGKPLQR